MGITFRVEGTHEPSPVIGPCPACGVDAFAGRGHACDACQGYGGDTVAEWAAHDARSASVLDVSMGTAAIILAWLGRASDLDGEMPGAQALACLAAAFPPLDAVEPNESQGVYIDANGVGPGCRVVECGINEDRLERHRARLVALATEAAESGRNLEWF